MEWIEQHGLRIEPGCCVAYWIRGALGARELMMIDYLFF